MWLRMLLASILHSGLNTWWCSVMTRQTFKKKMFSSQRNPPLLFFSLKWIQTTRSVASTAFRMMHSLLSVQQPLPGTRSKYIDDTAPGHSMCQQRIPAHCRLSRTTAHPLGDSGEKQHGWGGPMPHPQGTGAQSPTEPVWHSRLSEFLPTHDLISSQTSPRQQSFTSFKDSFLFIERHQQTTQFSNARHPLGPCCVECLASS